MSECVVSVSVCLSACVCLWCVMCLGMCVSECGVCLCGLCVFVVSVGCDCFCGVFCVRECMVYCLLPIVVCGTCCVFGMSVL